MIKFSIITVVKNDLIGLKKTFHSIRSQIFENYEWIVIDALSEDGCSEFLESLNQANIKFISEKDNGIYDGMNKGIKLCSGDYVIFLNAGDFFVTDMVLNKIKDCLIENPSDVFFGNVRMKFKNTSFIRGFRRVSSSQSLTSLPGHHQGTFYRAGLLKKFPYQEDYFISGDYYIICKLFKEGFQHYVYADTIVSEFEVGHFSYNNIFAIWNCSNKIQKDILNLKFHFRIGSALKRLLNSFVIIILHTIPRIPVRFGIIKPKF